MAVTSSKTQADFDEILHACLDIAQMRLDTTGETSTYAVLKPFSGELMALEPEPEDVSAAAGDIEAAVLKQALHVAHAYCAVGIVATVKALDAEFVRVDLEHREGVWQTMLLPFQREESGVIFGDLQNTPGTRQIWN